MTPSLLDLSNRHLENVEALARAAAALDDAPTTALEASEQNIRALTVLWARTQKAMLPQRTIRVMHKAYEERITEEQRWAEELQGVSDRLFAQLDIPGAITAAQRGWITPPDDPVSGVIAGKVDNVFKRWLRTRKTVGSGTPEGTGRVSGLRPGDADKIEAWGGKRGDMGWLASQSVDQSHVRVMRDANGDPVAIASVGEEGGNLDVRILAAKEGHGAKMMQQLAKEAAAKGLGMSLVSTFGSEGFYKKIGMRGEGGGRMGWSPDEAKVFGITGGNIAPPGEENPRLNEALNLAAQQMAFTAIQGEPGTHIPENVKRALASRVNREAFERGGVQQYLGLALRTSEKAGQISLEQLGLKQTWAWAHPQNMAQDMFQVRGSKIIQNMYGNHINKLSEIITEATDPRTPWTVQDVERRIKTEWPRLSGYQVERIARTETAAVWTATSMAAYEANGIEEWESIVASGPSIDEATAGACDFCVAMGATRHDIIDDPPPWHPNCRCEAVPSLEREGEDGESIPWLPPQEPWTGGGPGSGARDFEPRPVRDVPEPETLAVEPLSPEGQDIRQQVADAQKRVANMQAERERLSAAGDKGAADLLDFQIQGEQQLIERWLKQLGDSPVPVSDIPGGFSVGQRLWFNRYGQRTEGEVVGRGRNDPEKVLMRFENKNGVMNNAEARVDEIEKPIDTKPDAPPEEFPPMTSLNPTGGVFVEYGPEARAKAPLGGNLTTLDKTMEVAPDTEVTIYRGAPAEQKEIVPGDFVTTNRQLAEDYAGDGHVIEMKVPASHVLDDASERLGEEYIYRPPTGKPPVAPEYTGEALPEAGGNPFAITKEDLTKDEVHAIASYTHSTGIDGFKDYLTVNRWLRKLDVRRGKPLQAIHRTVHVLDDVIQKAPALEQETTLYRGVASTEHYGVPKVGESYTDEAFLSTSLDSRLPTSWADTRGDLWEIRAPAGTKGVNVNEALKGTPYGPVGLDPATAKELEVVLARGTKVVVDEVTERVTTYEATGQRIVAHDVKAHIESQPEKPPALRGEKEPAEPKPEPDIVPDEHPVPQWIDPDEGWTEAKFNEILEAQLGKEVRLTWDSGYGKQITEGVLKKEDDWLVIDNRTLGNGHSVVHMEVRGADGEWRTLAVMPERLRPAPKDVTPKPEVPKPDTPPPIVPDSGKVLLPSQRINIKFRAPTTKEHVAEGMTILNRTFRLPEEAPPVDLIRGSGSANFEPHGWRNGTATGAEGAKIRGFIERPDHRTSSGTLHTAREDNIDTLYHEMGHYVDWAVFGGRMQAPTFATESGAGELADLMRAIRNTPEWEEWDALYKGGGKMDGVAHSTKGHAKYMRSNVESFARAFAQYNMERSLDPKLIEWVAERARPVTDGNGAMGWYWTPEHFKPIAEEFDKVFKERGMLPEVKPEPAPTPAPAPEYTPTAPLPSDILTADNAAERFVHGLRQSEVERGNVPDETKLAEAKAAWEKRIAPSISTDAKAAQRVADAVRYNAKSNLHTLAQSRLGADNVLIIKTDAKDVLLSTGREESAGQRLTGPRVTVIKDETTKQERLGRSYPGDSSSMTNGGVEAALRHEYGHQIEESLTAEQKAEFRKMLPHPAEVRRDLSKYAATDLEAGNAQEAFCELYAIVSDPAFRAEEWPEWVPRAEAKIKEWLREPKAEAPKPSEAPPEPVPTPHPEAQPHEPAEPTEPDGGTTGLKDTPLPEGIDFQTTEGFERALASYEGREIRVTFAHGKKTAGKVKIKSVGKTKDMNMVEHERFSYGVGGYRIVRTDLIEGFEVKVGGRYKPWREFERMSPEERNRVVEPSGKPRGAKAESEVVVPEGGFKFEDAPPSGEIGVCPPTPQFQSLAEAKSFAEQYIAREVEFTGSRIDLKGVQASLDAMAKVFRPFGVKLQRLHVEKPSGKASQALAFYRSGGTSKLTINGEKQYWSNGDMIQSQNQVFQAAKTKAMVERTQSIFDQNKVTKIMGYRRELERAKDPNSGLRWDSEEKRLQRIEQLERAIKATEASDRWFIASSDPEHATQALMAHEAGHALSYHMGEEWNHKDGLADLFYSRMELHGVTLEDKMRVSEYATTGDKAQQIKGSEMFAEVTAAKIIGKYDLVPENIRAAYEETLASVSRDMIDKKVAQMAERQEWMTLTEEEKATRIADKLAQEAKEKADAQFGAGSSDAAVMLTSPVNTDRLQFAQARFERTKTLVREGIDPRPSSADVSPDVLDMVPEGRAIDIPSAPGTEQIAGTWVRHGINWKSSVGAARPQGSVASSSMLGIAVAIAMTMAIPGPHLGEGPQADFAALAVFAMQMAEYKKEKERRNAKAEAESRRELERTRQMARAAEARRTDATVAKRWAAVEKWAGVR